MKRILQTLLLGLLAICGSLAGEVEKPAGSQTKRPRRIPMKDFVIRRLAGRLIAVLLTGSSGTFLGQNCASAAAAPKPLRETKFAGCFPSLTRAQVYECLAYYEDHRGEMDLLVARPTVPTWREVPLRP